MKAQKSIRIFVQLLLVLLVISSLASFLFADPRSGSPSTTSGAVGLDCNDEGGCEEIDEVWVLLTSKTGVNQGSQDVWDPGADTDGDDSGKGDWISYQEAYPSESEEEKKVVDSVKGNAIADAAQVEYETWNKGKLDECDAGADSFLEGYYNTCNLQISWTCGGTPWSGGFISYVVKDGAGVSSFPDPSCSHSAYFSEIRDSTKGKYSCTAYDIDDYIADVQVGDIVCYCDKDNGADCSGVYRDNDALSHCDVVYDVSDGPEKAVVIGGNVGDTVKKRTVDLTRNRNEFVSFIRC